MRPTTPRATCLLSISRSHQHVAWRMPRLSVSTSAASQSRLSFASAESCAASAAGEAGGGAALLRDAPRIGESIPAGTAPQEARMKPASCSRAAAGTETRASISCGTASPGTSRARSRSENSGHSASNAADAPCSANRWRTRLAVDLRSESLDSSAAPSHHAVKRSRPTPAHDAASAAFARSHESSWLRSAARLVGVAAEFCSRGGVRCDAGTRAQRGRWGAPDESAETQACWQPPRAAAAATSRRTRRQRQARQRCTQRRPWCAEKPPSAACTRAAATRATVRSRAHGRRSGAEHAACHVTRPPMRPQATDARALSYDAPCDAPASWPAARGAHGNSGLTCAEQLRLKRERRCRAATVGLTFSSVRRVTACMWRLWRQAARSRWFGGAAALRRLSVIRASLTRVCSRQVALLAPPSPLASRII